MPTKQRKLFHFSSVDNTLNLKAYWSTLKHIEVCLLHISKLPNFPNCILNLCSGLESTSTQSAFKRYKGTLIFSAWQVEAVANSLNQLKTLRKGTGLLNSRFFRIYDKFLISLASSVRANWKIFQITRLRSHQSSDSGNIIIWCGKQMQLIYQHMHSIFNN